VDAATPTTEVVQLKTYEMRCSECGAVATDDARGWQAHIADLDDDGDDDVALFCQRCADREFGRR
jgi:hypothetical protein